MFTTNLLTTVTAVGAPQTIDEFNAVCADLGVTAQCCVLPIVSLLTHVTSCNDANAIAARPGSPLRFPVERESTFWFGRLGLLRLSG